MQRWNGWGDDAIHMDVPSNGLALLVDRIGAGRVQPDYSLKKILQKVPPSRLPDHPLISLDSKSRLDHAHGQSLPDWVGLRWGTLERFPDGVAMPERIEDLQMLLKFAAEQNCIVIPYGGGTSVVGHLEVPQTDRPVLSMSLEKLNRLLGLDSASLLATFEPGIRGPKIEEQLNSRGFTLGHYPQSVEDSTRGGWVATRSTGQQSRHYGRIEQLFAGGEVLSFRGLLQFPPFPASAAGPDLRHLVLGSEGRMGVLSKVIVRISRLPEQDDVYGFFFPSWGAARQAVQTLAGSGLPFSMLRLSNPAETTTNLMLAGHEKQIALLSRYLKMRGISAEDACMCLIGFSGTRSLVRTARRGAFSIFRRCKGVSTGQVIGKAWKKNRFRSAYLRNTLWDYGYALDTLETAVTWDKVDTAMAAIENALKGAKVPRQERLHVMTHLSHVYPTGTSIYTTFVFRLQPTASETLILWQALKQAASQSIVAAGGTISHQHGVGVDHKRYLPAEKGEIGVHILQQIFSHLDPDQRMNPGKLV